MDKILVIQTASIGDVILTTPVLEKLHFHFPEAAIDVLIKKGNEALFEAHPFINQLWLWNKHEDKYKNFFRLFREIKAQKYDAVINLQRYASSGFLTAFSGAGLKVGFNKNPFSLFFNKKVKHTIGDGKLHEVERNQKLVASFTDATSFPVKLYPTAKSFARMSQYKTKVYITISPASLWFTKQFPKEKWIQFVEKMESSMLIFFLGSQKDAELCEDIIKISGHENSLNLSGKLSLLDSAALMRDARMNYMNDSAPMHLASALNAPTTAVFCSTVPAFGFGPLAEDSAIVETTQQLACRPCGLHGFRSCPKKHFKCAYSIDVKQLLNRL